jgi:hypothetical protein
MIPIYPKSDKISWGINGLICKSYLNGMMPETNLISLFTKLLIWVMVRVVMRFPSCAIDTKNNINTS